VLQDAGDPLDDGKAQPEAAVLLVGVGAEPAELLEDLALPLGRDADAGVDHLDPEPAASAPDPYQHAALARVADRVRDQVHECSREHVAIGADHRRGRYEAERQALALGQRRELGHEPAQQRPERHVVGRGPDHAGIELRDVEEGAEQPLDRLERGLGIGDQRHGIARQLGLGQRTQEEPRCVQGLEQVVRGGGQEAGLGEVGGLGQRLGLAQGLVAALELGQGLLQLGRTLADLGLEQGGTLEERELGALQVHAPLDPAHEHVADLAQLRVLALELGKAGFGVAARNGHGIPPMAMPVKVWFTCMRPHCSP
jgi:hypothetical protein